MDVKIFCRAFLGLRTWLYQNIRLVACKFETALGIGFREKKISSDACIDPRLFYGFQNGAVCEAPLRVNPCLR
jgi:hypothetical protein